MPTRPETVMNLRALSNFLSVAEAGSLNGAADVVHIAQPALTRQIALLEEEFGTKLFVRHHRGVTLTQAGAQLREHAERIVAEVSKTRAAMSNALETPTGSVSLGLPTAMRYVLSSAVIAAYHKAFPNVQIRAHEAFAHVIEDMLESRQLDIAILFGGSPRLDSFDVRPLVTENVYLVGPASSGLDVNTPVSIILISRRNQLRLAAEQAMAACGRQFAPFLEVEGQPLTHDLVMKGVGYTITPYCAVQTEIESGLLSGAPIRGLTISWALGVNRVRAHAPAVRELIKLIQQAVDDRVANGSWQAIKVPNSTRKPAKRGARPVRSRKSRNARS